jgi:hypothetical protein
LFVAALALWENEQIDKMMLLRRTKQIASDKQTQTQALTQFHKRTGNLKDA